MQKKTNKGASLFDLAGASDNNVSESIQLHGEDYSFNDLIKYEANLLGMFISGHPTSRLGHVAKALNPTKLKDVLNSNGGNKTFNVLGTITNLKVKTNKKGNKSIAVLIDDGIDTVATYLPGNIIASIEKGEELQRIANAKEKGKLEALKRSDKQIALVHDESIKTMAPVELNEPYLFKVKVGGWGDTVNIYIIDVEKLNTAHDGSLPYEVNVPSKTMLNEIRAVLNKHKYNEGTYVKLNLDNASQIETTRVKLSIEFIVDMENIIGKENIVTEDI